MKRILTVFFCALILHGVCVAQIPQTMSYQGILKDADGKLVTDGTYTVHFKLYDVQTGGTSVWSEQQSVSVKNGIMNVILGSNKSLNIPFDKQYWLTMQVGGDDQELTPRLQLTASPYSLNAKSIADSAVTAGKIPAGQVVKSINTMKDNVTVEAGDNITITNNNNKVRISATGGGLSLPYSGSTSSSSDAFKITTNGTGSAGEFWNINSSNTEPALYVGTSGSGSGILAGTSGTGSAGSFLISNSSNSTYALSASTNGSGTALYANGSGTGYGGWFQISNSNNSNDAIVSYNSGKGYSGYFYGAGTYSKGVYISVPSGNSGLNVSSGTKNAIVATSQGARKLYTEESSGVWFTDYGFGTLENGTAIITIDPLFSETVNLSEKYHVFIQSYGDADIYVSKRTPLQFEVRLRDGDKNVEFSYRLVAKRKGYEQARLEHEPSGDDDPNLYPVKAGAQKISSQSKYFQMQQELESQRKKLEGK